MECNIYSSIEIPFSQKFIQKKVVSILSVLKKNGDISIHFIGDAKMTSLNFAYRGKKKPTDVLSFAAQEGILIGKELEWGDVFICLPQVKRQAKELGISWKEEMYRMMIHGVLHLLGYDHLEKKDANKMFPLQEKLLKQIYE
jgi:probable rRNA maturation factor